MQTSSLSLFSERHLKKIKDHFDADESLSYAARSYRRLLAHYYNLLIPPSSSVLEVGCGSGELLALIEAKRKVGVDISEKQIARARERVPDAIFHQQSGECLSLDEVFDIIILSETLNFAADAQALLDQLSKHATHDSRLLINFHNNLWRPAHGMASLIGFRRLTPPTSWLSSEDVINLLSLSQWEVIKTQSRMLWPINTPLIAPILNRWIAPAFPSLGFTIFQVARLKPVSPHKKPTISIIVPARNECGNIEAAVKRIPDFGVFTELIFVEGHSTDKTWHEIERVKQLYSHLNIRSIQQTGKGKGNAVREGFDIATADLLMILDADLTMPPEDLPKFYEAVASGKTEFANGSRLVYPMEDQAMQFLNMIANKFFGIAFTWLLGQSIKDTLCGTKVLYRRHYKSIVANRGYFGEFDPFGDFDLLFGADKLSLKIRDIPIRYRERTYGTTNINRWRHGMLLFRMLIFAAKKLKFI